VIIAAPRIARTVRASAELGDHELEDEGLLAEERRPAPKNLSDCKPELANNVQRVRR